MTLFCFYLDAAKRSILCRQHVQQAEVQGGRNKHRREEERTRKKTKQQEKRSRVQVQDNNRNNNCIKTYGQRFPLVAWITDSYSSSRDDTKLLNLTNTRTERWKMETDPKLSDMPRTRSTRQRKEYNREQDGICYCKHSHFKPGNIFECNECNKTVYLFTSEVGSPLITEDKHNAARKGSLILFLYSKMNRYFTEAGYSKEFGRTTSEPHVDTNNTAIKTNKTAGHEMRKNNGNEGCSNAEETNRDSESE